MRPYVFSLFFVALWTTACAHAPSASSPPVVTATESAPTWFSESGSCGEGEQGAPRFCGSGSGRTTEEAREAAQATALQTAAAVLGTQVQARFESDNRCSSATGCASEQRSRVQSLTRKINFRGVQTISARTDAGRGGFRSYVRIEVPAAEWQRQELKSWGRTLIAVDCRVGDAPCASGDLESLLGQLPACGVEPTAGMSWQAADGGDATRQALVKGAAQALFLSIRLPSPTASGGLTRAQASGRWEWIDTVEGRTVLARPVEAAAAVDPLQARAVAKALKNLADRTADRSCGLATASGSLCCALREQGSTAAP